MDSDRRAILMAGVATAMAGGGGGRAVAEGTQAPPPVAGPLRLDDEARAAAAEDFGHIVRRMPQGVLLPASDQEIATMIRWAGNSQRKIAPQGQRHSVYGRAQVSDGMVIDMTQLRAVHEVRDDRVVVGAGATWSEVLAATLPRGLTPPVLTDYLDLSVGGTLTVGGIGGTTSQHGMQSDNVLELDVITGRGQKITCSSLGNAGLYDAVRAGLGQVGVITRATLKLVPAPEKVRRYLLTYPDLATLLKDERLLATANRFEAVQGSILPTPAGWTFKLDAVRCFSGDDPPDDKALLVGLSDDRSAAKLSTLSYVDYLKRLAALEQLLRSKGQWSYPHPWLMTFVGDSRIDSVASAELDRLTPADLGTFGQIVLSAFHRASVTTPLLQLPADSLVYAFNLVRIPTTDAVAEADRLVTANRAIYERVRGAGGTLYPVSALPMSSDDWRRHFGSAWHQLRDAKQTFDPGHILTPGYEIF
ncbi:MAG TPA: FAD-binding protein [Reyranella sp.]|jgi:FAD/FMN-containing dehydrogenase|nr:FAD-binding protein [Reyranella sp.]